MAARRHEISLREKDSATSESNKTQRNAASPLRCKFVSNYFLRWPTTVTSKPNAHSKFKSLTTNSNHSQHFQITHSKFKSSATANYKSLTANSNHTQQIIHHQGKFKMIDHARCLQSPPTSGARRQRIFVIHEASTCEVSAPALLETFRF